MQILQHVSLTKVRAQRHKCCADWLWVLTFAWMTDGGVGSSFASRGGWRMPDGVGGMANVCSVCAPSVTFGTTSPWRGRIGWIAVLLDGLAVPRTRLESPP